MVQVNGICRLLTQRFSNDFVESVKYSTLCPSRSDSPWEARRAMPTRAGLSGRESRGKDDIPRFAFCSPNILLPDRLCQDLEGSENIGRSETQGAENGI